MKKQEELMELFLILHEWAVEADFILSMDENFGDFHALMNHLRGDGKMENLQHVLSAIFRNIGYVHAGEMADCSYPPRGISREDFLSHRFMDIEEWADMNLELLGKSYDTAKSALLHNDEDGNSILCLQDVIHQIRRVVDDYFSGMERDRVTTGGAGKVSFRKLSHKESDWLKKYVLNLLDRGEKMFLTLPEIDRVGTMIAYDSSGTLADLLSPAWTRTMQ